VALLWLILVVVLLLTFIAGDGMVINSVVFDDVGSCVPVLTPATEGV